MTSDTPPLVSICSITYNHAPFIRQCLDGMLMQKCNFEYEIIINDDCSTDGTTEIIREYEAKYPGIIKPIYHEENEYSKGVRGMFATYVFPKARGKYIALCEGDDYWTDPLKLQKQVDFLESHPDYSMCFHNAMNHYENVDREDDLFATYEEGEFSRKKLIHGWWAPTASFCFRNEVLSSSIYRKVCRAHSIVQGDIALVTSATYSGKVWGMEDVMSVYRRSAQGIMNNIMDGNPIIVFRNYVELQQIFSPELEEDFNAFALKYTQAAVSMVFKGKLKEGLKFWTEIWMHDPLGCVRETFLCFVRYCYLWKYKS